MALAHPRPLPSDIPKADIDLLLKDHPGGDKQIRVSATGRPAPIRKAHLFAKSR
jgi:hypothetical protein